MAYLDGLDFWDIVENQGELWKTNGVSLFWASQTPSIVTESYIDPDVNASVSAYLTAYIVYHWFMKVYVSIRMFWRFDERLFWWALLRCMSLHKSSIMATSRNWMVGEFTGKHHIGSNHGFRLRFPCFPLKPIHWMSHLLVTSHYIPIMIPTHIVSIWSQYPLLMTQFANWKSAFLTCI